MFLLRLLKIKEDEGLFLFFIENGAKFPLFRGYEAWLMAYMSIAENKEEALFYFVVLRDQTLW